VAPREMGFHLGKARALIELKRYDTALEVIAEVEKSPKAVMKSEAARLRKIIDDLRTPAQ